MDRCEECGRPLKSVESMVRGVGPVCAQKIGRRISEAKTVVGRIKDPQLRRSKELEIAVAEHVGDKIVMFNQKFGINGEDGEIDVATKTVIIEVTIEPRGKFTQTTIRFRNPPLNTTRKSVVLYAPKYKLTPKKAVCHKGVRHATNFTELDAARQ